MKIRKAEISDCKKICQLLKTPELIDSLANIDMKDYLNKIAGKNDLFLVAEIEKKVVGFVLGEELLGKCAYAHLMAVDNNFRGKGIGGELMETLKKKAKIKKIDYLFFFAPKENSKLVEFYKNHKFNRKGEYILFDTAI